MTLQLEKVASGLGFPEGPVAMNDGTLIFVDIERETLCRLGTDGAVSDVAKLPGGPNGTAIGPDGAAYICNNGGVYSFVQIPDPLHKGKKATIPSPERPNYQGGSIQRVDLASGDVTTLYTECDGTRLIAPDDIVFDADGGMWFTDTGMAEGLNRTSGAVYYATADGQSITRAATVTTANGIGLSPDGKTLIVSDTIFGRVWAMEILGPGKLKPGLLPEMPGNVLTTLPGFQWLDSLRIEADGRACVGTIFTGGITVVSPDGSTEHMEVPDLFTTNLAFGGSDMQDVWITASSTGCIYKTRWPRPGLKLAFCA